MNIQVHRVCALCNKSIGTDDEFFSNNSRHGWTFAHSLCREVIIMEQQYAVLNYVRDIGSRTRRKK